MESLAPGEQVLVFASDPETRAALRPVLRKGARMQVAETREAVWRAIAKAKDHVPALVLTDFDMPGVDGFEVLQRLRSEAATRDVPVVLLTAQSSHAQSLAALELPATATLAKTDMQALSDRLARLTCDRAMQRSYREAYFETLERGQAGEADLTEGERTVLATIGYPLDEPLNVSPLARRAALFDSILASSLTTAEAAKKLRVNASRIRQQLLSNPPELYGVRVRKEWRLPKFQFHGKGLVSNIRRVIPKLPSDLDPVAVHTWFHAPNVDLVHEGQEASPLGWLSQGLDPERVAALARDL